MMKTRFLALVTALGMGGATSLAHAQDTWYVSIQGGGSFLSDTDLKGLGLETEFDPGFSASGSAGVALRNNLRFEAEVSFAQNDIDQFSAAGVSVAGGGDVDALAFMANAFYDLDIGGPWQVYVGGGAGVARVSVDDLEILGVGVSLKEDDDAVFAYQAGAGMGYRISPSTTVTLDYRFFGTADPDFQDEFGDSFEAEYQRHDLRLGLRFRFGSGPWE